MSRVLEGQLKSRRRYSSLSAFYTSDRRRVESKESDVGLWWREAADGPLHRAAWVKDTGELYLVRLGPAEDGGGEVEVLAVDTDRKHLDDVLDGWREQCGRPNSVSWLRSRAVLLGKVARTAQLRMAGAATAAALAVALTLEFS
jgi:hypothetical protein